MRQRILLVTILLYLPVLLAGQEKTFADTAATIFHEIQAATAAHKGLWHYDIYAPILLVRPQDGKIFANLPDTTGKLVREQSIYTGILPRNINIANTALHWAGEDWAVIMLPLPETEADRLNLITHELFHRAQPHLGFKLYNTDNNHLDQKEGRIYLRLELAALQAALLSPSQEEMKSHVAHALAFRFYRHSLFPGSDSTENQLELNEGLAEYTGCMLSGRTPEAMRTHFVRFLHEFFNNPTFVRSFAYHTIPLYGYLLAQTKPQWNNDIAATTDLSSYFLKSFQYSLPANLHSTIQKDEQLYQGEHIAAEETLREEKRNALLAEYEDRLITRPHLELPLHKMNVSFDPRNILPLKNKGTVYPTMRVTDVWGVLTAANGALMSPQWNSISVSAPVQIQEHELSGDGWNLELHQGYSVRQDSTSKNYFLESAGGK